MIGAGEELVPIDADPEMRASGTGGLPWTRVRAHSTACWKARSPCA
jgi:hypothetical protein